MVLKIKKMLDQNMEQKRLYKQISKTNLFITKGFKENIEKFFQKSCFLIKKQKKQNPILQLGQGIEMISPFYEIKSIKMKNIPVEITKKRQQLLAMKLFFSAVKNKKLLFLHNKIATELVEILNITGDSFRIYENLKKDAQANKIFIPYMY